MKHSEMGNVILFSKLHSIIDIITNSSSELFICNESKSVDIIMGGLQSMVDLYNKLHDDDYTFDSIFGDIYELTENNVDEYIEKYCINWNFIPHGITLDRLEDKYDFEVNWMNRNGKEIKYPWDENQDYNESIHTEATAEYNKYFESWKNNGNYEILKNELIGRICITSANENSIPYELFDMIEVIVTEFIP